MAIMEVDFLMKELQGLDYLLNVRNTQLFMSLVETGELKKGINQSLICPITALKIINLFEVNGLIKLLSVNNDKHNRYYSVTDKGYMLHKILYGFIKFEVRQNELKSFWTD